METNPVYLTVILMVVYAFSGRGWFPSFTVDFVFLQELREAEYIPIDDRPSRSAQGRYASWLSFVFVCLN